MPDLFLLVNTREPQLMNAKLVLPIMLIGIVAYAFTLLWNNFYETAVCGLSLLVLYSAPRGFSPGTAVFPSPQKPAFDLI